MMNFTVISALIWTFSWISASVSQFHTVEIQSGEEVTLMCSNYSGAMTHIFWFRLDNGPNTTCISYMLSSDANFSFCDGFQNDKFNMSSNITTLFLNINPVDLSDSGLYFCGIYLGQENMGKTYRHPAMFTATYLKLQDRRALPLWGCLTSLTGVILGGLIVLLIIVIIILVVKIKKRHTANKEEQNPQYSQNLSSDEVNYAALNFLPKGRRSKRSGSVTEMEQEVVYTATR